MILKTLIRIFNQASKPTEIRIKPEQERGERAGTESYLKFFAFLEQERALILKYKDEPRCVILCLSNAQKRIFWHIAMECINRNSHNTGPIEIKGFFEDLPISIPVVRTTLNRLVDKHIIQREKGKLGKNGFAIISLPKVMLNSSRELLADFRARASSK